MRNKSSVPKIHILIKSARKANHINNKMVYKLAATNLAKTHCVLLYGVVNNNLNVPKLASPESMSAAIKATNKGTCTSNNCNKI